MIQFLEEAVFGADRAPAIRFSKRRMVRLPFNERLLFALASTLRRASPYNGFYFSTFKVKQVVGLSHSTAVPTSRSHLHPRFSEAAARRTSRTDWQLLQPVVTFHAVRTTCYSPVTRR